ncbi:hypothetical protein [Deinococcus sp. QL22]|uniref:hypothetical protein n=1 Tax=Deinococcus sp. QL22 TaxID=2939437 RepID=UPI0020177823|nr:hypothetical protein [Deinococcus sp. QL22]UQN06274.1 hypothetical protein M1R55_15660 [Deinococcus sp. QL22]
MKPPLMYGKSALPTRHAIAPDDPMVIDTVVGLVSVTLNGTPLDLNNVYGQTLLPGDVLDVLAGPDGGSINGYHDAAHAASALSLRVRSSLIDLYDNEPTHPDSPYAQRVAFTLNAPQGFNALYLWGDAWGATVGLREAAQDAGIPDLPFVPLGVMQDPYGGPVTVYRPNFNSLSPGAYLLTVTGGDPTVSEIGGTTLGQYFPARIARASAVSYKKQDTQGGPWTDTPYGPSVQLDQYEFPPHFFNKILGRPIWRTALGTWVDATGTEV